MDRHLTPNHARPVAIIYFMRNAFRNGYSQNTTFALFVCQARIYWKGLRKRGSIDISEIETNSPEIYSLKKPIHTAAGLFAASQISINCAFCNEKNHESKNCKLALNLDLQEKTTLLAKKKCCYRCFKTGHMFSRQKLSQKLESLLNLFPITDENYPLAIESLTERYGRKEQSATNVMKEGMFDLREWESSAISASSESTRSPVLGLIWEKNLDTLEIDSESLEFDKKDN
ncbi:hypothetical protein CEXT_33231 [Caerostris extrusa]|uniref:Uncharacterized protein n=1 Tax=Caerostris extrusa TaxID=172846 RepID=A0AAV4XDV3_CAEEX|nr:hypothetical protein CEXT_33231 [Caerostris extrusa]